MMIVFRGLVARSLTANPIRSRREAGGDPVGSRREGGAHRVEPGGQI